MMSRSGRSLSKMAGRENLRAREEQPAPVHYRDSRVTIDSDMMCSPLSPPPLCPTPRHESFASHSSGPEPSYHGGHVELINYEYADTEDELHSHQSDLDRQFRFSDNFSQLADLHSQFDDHELRAEDEFQPNGQFRPSYQFTYDGHRSEPATMDDDYPVEAPRSLSPIPYSESNYQSDNTSMNDVMEVVTNSHGFSVNSRLSIDSLDRLSEIRRHGPALYGMEQAEIVAFKEENGTDWRHAEVGYGRPPVVHPEVEISSPPPDAHTSISRPMPTKLPPPMMVGLGAHPAVLEKKGAKDEKGKGKSGQVKGKGKSGVKLGWMLRIFGRGGKGGRWV